MTSFGHSARSAVYYQAVSLLAERRIILPFGLHYRYRIQYGCIYIAYDIQLCCYYWGFGRLTCVPQITRVSVHFGAPSSWHATDYSNASCLILQWIVLGNEASARGEARVGPAVVLVDHPNASLCTPARCRPNPSIRPRMHRLFIMFMLMQTDA
jgi:hypothetical protein